MEDDNLLEDHKMTFEHSRMMEAENISDEEQDINDFNNDVQSVKWNSDLILNSGNYAAITYNFVDDADDDEDDYNDADDGNYDKGEHVEKNTEHVIVEEEEENQIEEEMINLGEGKEGGEEGGQEGGEEDEEEEAGEPEMTAKEKEVSSIMFVY